MTPQTVAGTPPGEAHPAIRLIGLDDVREALRLGWDDFMAKPSHIVFLFLIYPAIGFMLSYAAFNYALMPLLYPMAAGFALIAPISAVGVFELSRRRETGEAHPDLSEALGVFSSSSSGAILRVALLLFALFVVWLVVAQQIVFSTIGEETPGGIRDFLGSVATTGEGRRMFWLGNGIGFLFAVAALVISVFSLPMLVNGATSARHAVSVSVRACLANPVAMTAWGLTVAVLLAVGMLPFFAGLLVVLPWLGHATWHLYRRTIQS